MKKYWQLFKTWLGRTLIYRARVVIWFCTDIIQFAVMPFIWLSVYGSRVSIGGYSKTGIITYYAVGAFISTVASSHIASIIRKEINQGSLNKYLVKPVSFLFSECIHKFSFKVVSTLLILILGAGVAVCFPSLWAFPQSPITILLFCLSVLFSLAIAQILQLIIGVSAIWLGEVTALSQVHRILSSVFSGELAPLTFFPLFFQTLAGALPFFYMTYFPIQIFLEKIPFNQIGWYFLGALAWVAGLGGLLFLMWKRALKHYDGSSM